MRTITILSIFVTLALAGRAAHASPGRYVSSNKEATLYQQRSSDPNPTYTPEADESQYGLLLANFENNIVRVWEVYGNVTWSAAVEDLVKQAPSDLNKQSSFKLSRVKYVAGTKRCKRAVDVLKGEGEHWGTDPVVTCQPALVLRAKK